MSEVKTATIQIRWQEHRPTGLLAAFSDDLKGLLVIGHSTSEIIQNLPGAVRQILQAQGIEVVSIEIGPNLSPEAFFPPAYTINADIREAA